MDTCRPKGLGEKVNFPFFISGSYLIATKGELYCPQGYESIATFEKCKLASTAVGTLGWNGEILNGHSHRMPYCWIGVAGKANYNGNGDHSDGYSDSKLICKQDIHTIETPTTHGMNCLINFLFPS